MSQKQIDVHIPASSGSVGTSSEGSCLILMLSLGLKAANAERDPAGEV